MPEPRKIFRIEETTAARLDGHDAGVPEPREPLRHAELMTEIAGLRAMVAAMAQPHVFNGEARNGDTARLTSELNLIAGAIGGQSGGPLPDDGMARMTRIAHELEEVVNATEQATQKVLASAEEIDQLANNLIAALQGKFEQGLVKDIQDLVVRIFEACNFQDLSGRRRSAHRLRCRSGRRLPDPSSAAPWCDRLTRRFRDPAGRRRHRPGRHSSCRSGCP